MSSDSNSLQLTLGVDQPHNNRTLFSDHYLEQLLPADPRWPSALPEAASFLAWLQDRYVAAPETFDDLRNKGKRESTLWKAKACRPFVDQESRSTRHLDYSLGWNEEAFKAFVKALAGAVHNLSNLVHVYRAHQPRYHNLLHRLTRTDHLIDQVVYQLYGLTEDEIAIVEGR